jgi:hypothetical protein
MRLVHRRTLKKEEAKYVYPPAEALKQIKTALFRYQKIEGLAELRRGLMINLDHYAWQEIERGEWLLIKPEARSFDWAHFEPEAFRQRVDALLANPPPQPKPLQLIFRAIESKTGDRIASQKYIARLDGVKDSRKIDDQGIGFVPLPSKKATVSVCLMEG